MQEYIISADCTSVNYKPSSLVKHNLCLPEALQDTRLSKGKRKKGLLQIGMAEKVQDKMYF